MRQSQSRRCLYIEHCKCRDSKEHNPKIEGANWELEYSSIPFCLSAYDESMEFWDQICFSILRPFWCLWTHSIKSFRYCWGNWSFLRKLLSFPSRLAMIFVFAEYVQYVVHFFDTLLLRRWKATFNANFFSSLLIIMLHYMFSIVASCSSN